MNTEQIKRKEREKYDAGAEAFHACWGPYNGRIARDLADLAGAAPGESVLEIASGWGEAGLRLAERVGDRGRVTITDLSPGILEVARRLAAERNVANAAFRVMDGERLELPDAACDAVVCGMGIMFMPDAQRVLAEVHRVLTPGGRAAFSVWGEPARVPFLTQTINAFMNHAAPLPARLLLRTPWVGARLRMRVLTTRNPAGLSPLRFGMPGTLEPVLERAGFTDVRRERRAYRMEFPRFEDFWETYTTGVPGVRDVVATLDASTIAAIEADVRGRIVDAATGGVRLDNEVAFVTGRKPP